MVAVAIAFWVVPRTWVLLRDTINVLLEGVPQGIDLNAVRREMTALPGVGGVHDLHIWSMSNADISASAHVLLGDGADPDGVRKSVAALLDTRFGIAHATIQTETVDSACGDAPHLHA